ncbi:hypothetical protein SCB49_05712 [unidentified eubacterium SCB49]|nr:hypothetical protein SCB49_05712 [unidentified eubacterium SCB49]
MKNKLRDEIKDMASKISVTKDDFDILRLKASVTELQEKLTVLAYLESQLNVSEKEAFDTKNYKEEKVGNVPVSAPQPEHKEALVEPVIEKLKDIVAEVPSETQKVNDFLEEIVPKKKTIKNDLEDFAANYQQMPIFTRKEETPPAQTTAFVNKEPAKGKDLQQKKHTLNTDPAQPKSINDSIGGRLTIGLNDRLAFIKHLFEGHMDDYQRVLSQVSTMESYEAASVFLLENVKPDYNNWQGKEEFSDRFMAIIEKNFN